MRKSAAFASIALMTIVGLTHAQEMDEVDDPFADEFVSIDDRFDRSGARPDVPEPQKPDLSTPENVDTGKPPHEWQNMTDDWFGLRPKLDDRGITFAGSVASDWAHNMRGGANTQGWNFGHILDLSLTLNTDRLGLWKGGTFFTSFQNQHGEFASADVGDIQTVDSIDADGRTQISELWYEHALFDEKLRIRSGKLDAASDFNVTEHASDFVHSLMAATPTVLSMPTFPDSSGGLQVVARPCDAFYAGAGIFDGALQEGITTGDDAINTFFSDPADLFLIGEAGLHWNLKHLPGTAGVGLWHHTGTFDEFDGGVSHGATGFYVIADQRIYREDPADEENEQGAGVFFRYGWADADVSEIEHHIAAGLAWTGAVPSRDSDVLGIGCSCAVLSDDAGFDDEAEVAVELFYQIRIFPWLAVQPDVQYIINPGATGDQDDAVVGILRISMDL